MKKGKIPLLILAVIIVGVIIYFVAVRPPSSIVLTGVVTTDEVIVSPEIGGRLQKVLVREGDVVTNGELLAIIQPQSQEADMAFYTHTEQTSASQVTQAEADLKFQEAQTSNQVAQAEANLAAAQAQTVQAAAELENARLNYERQQTLHTNGVESQQSYDQARTAYDGAKAALESTDKQAKAAQAAVELARSNSEQVAAPPSKPAAINSPPPPRKRKRLRCNWATRKSIPHSTALSIRASRSRAKSSIPARPLSRSSTRTICGSAPTSRKATSTAFIAATSCR